MPGFFHWSLWKNFRAVSRNWAVTWKFNPGFHKPMAYLIRDSWWCINPGLTFVWLGYPKISTAKWYGYIRHIDPTWRIPPTPWILPCLLLHLKCVQVTPPLASLYPSSHVCRAFKNSFSLKLLCEMQRLYLGSLGLKSEEPNRQSSEG